MVRGQDVQTRVHFKGKNEDYIVFAESAQAVSEWKKDKSIPLVQVVNGFKIFVTHKHGNQGELNTASKGTLEDEFGTSRDDDVIKQILEQGSVHSHENAGRGGDKNITQGASVAH